MHLTLTGGFCKQIFSLFAFCSCILPGLISGYHIYVLDWDYWELQNKYRFYVLWQFLFSERYPLMCPMNISAKTYLLFLYLLIWLLRHSGIDWGPIRTRLRGRGGVEDTLRLSRELSEIAKRAWWCSKAFVETHLILNILRLGKRVGFVKVFFKVKVIGSGQSSKCTVFTFFGSRVG